MKLKKPCLVLVSICLILVVSCDKQKYTRDDPLIDKPAEEMSVEEMGRITVHMITNYGEFKIDLRPDWAPETTRNFIKLVKAGFYDGLTMHEVRPGIWIRGGCPLGDGSGGPGWTVPFEPSPGKHVKGTVGLYHELEMRNTGGSQFYIMLGPIGAMNDYYTAFGSVAEGMQTVERIGSLSVTPRGGRPRPYMPLNPVVIKDARILAEVEN